MTGGAFEALDELSSTATSTRSPSSTRRCFFASRNAFAPY